MEIDEIRLRIATARRCCADAQSFHFERDLSRNEVAELIDALSRLGEATESLLAEREAFSGRLSRRSAIRPVETPAISNVSRSEHPEATPSPASDA